jgi:ABC-type amino acid transport substrate-binding protein
MAWGSSRITPRFPALAALALTAACDLPRDAANTTERVEGGELRAGAVHDPPWVIVGDGEPRGIEPDLVRSFAAAMGSRVRWTVGSEGALVAALEQRALDVVVAGFLSSSPHGRRVGYVTPYVEIDVVVAARPGTGIDAIANRPVVRPAERPRLDALLLEAGAQPRLGPGFLGSEPLAAGYAPALEAAGRTRVVTVLASERHVIAVPPGESRFAARLERHLAGQRDGVLRALGEPPSRGAIPVAVSGDEPGSPR